MFHNAEHIPFLQELKELGKETQLDYMPELDEEANSLWEMYCFMGDDIIVCLDIYARRVGLPPFWDFHSCMLLVNKLKNKRAELDKLNREKSSNA